MDQESKMDPGLVKKLFEMGMMGIETPEAFGGTGSTFTSACLAIEEIGRIDGSVSVLMDVQNTLVTNAVLKWGTDAQKKEYLPKLLLSGLDPMLYESSSGSDAFALNLKLKIGATTF